MNLKEFVTFMCQIGHCDVLTSNTESLFSFDDLEWNDLVVVYSKYSNTE